MAQHSDSYGERMVLRCAHHNTYVFLGDLARLTGKLLQLL